ncbi:energy-coupling factor ABC transporter substrate-binding protein [Corynebacterium choanae]|uniref:Cobalt transport protein CbiN n=1 Tax=Corynebacterium choanae TaxID=1862358 RepID=A0A3G6J4H6_9CORY|nr:Cobalt transport protein CbiN [Corynebacterium choanae]
MSANNAVFPTNQPAVPNQQAQPAAPDPKTVDSGERHSIGSTIALILVALALAGLPLFYNLADPNSEEQFAGTDSTAEQVVEEVAPGYEPWFEPITPELAPEVESGLFALQAALGAGVLGYVLGVYRGRSRTVKRRN